MTEPAFVRLNQEKWQRYQEEASLSGPLKTDTLIANYQDVMADCAYAQSQFPGSRVSTYLNQLSTTYYKAIYDKRRLDWRRPLRFFFHDVPLEVAAYRKTINITCLIFCLLVAAGCISGIQDEENIVKTLGSGYVEMTLRNIKQGKPTDVYSHGSETSSFLSIVWNNLRVDLNTYAYGIVPILGPLYIMKVNGIMLGQFQTLFFLKGVGLQSMTAIWIHGTLEMGACVMACAAAMIFGLGWVFPGTRSRRQALMDSAKSSIRIFVSVLPLTFTAAIFEGFTTRHTEYPLTIKLGIIFGSLLLLVYYYGILPYRVSHKK